MMTGVSWVPPFTDFGRCLKVGAVVLIGLLSFGIYMDRTSDRMSLSIKPWSVFSLRYNASLQQNSHTLTNISNDSSTRHFYSQPKAGLFLTIRHGGRLGNVMFQYASLLGIAASRNMTPFVLPGSKLTQIFNISNVKNISNTKTWKGLGEKMYGTHDTDLISNMPSENATLRGYFQSFKNFQHVNNIIMSEFKFLPEINNRAEKILDSVINKDVRQNSIIVGVQVRRGDFLLERKIAHGYRVPGVAYFTKAFALMREKYKVHRFVVASNGMKWVKDNFKNVSDVAFLPNETAEVHLCALAKSNHVIISSGTYSWWAGYLAGGDVIYFPGYVAPGTPLAKGFTPRDYYPANWIALTDEATAE